MSPHGAAPLMASAADLLPLRSRFIPLAWTATATALATLFVANPAAAQSVEDRARAAAAAARARSADSDALQRNYVALGLAGQPITTVDNKRSFVPRLMCQKTATLMEVLVQPSGTGDLTSVQIARDTDFDGTVDSRSSLPVPVSGICANGVIACQPGTWSQCRNFRWSVDADRNLKLSEVQLGELAGCYCINNSCGANLAWGNLSSVLGDLGGGMVGALTTADSRIGVARAVVEGPMIRYVGAQATSCSSDPALPQTAYRANPALLAGDAQAAASSNRVFQMLAGSPAGFGKAQQLRHCTIERQVQVVKSGIDEIIQRTAGGYATSRQGNQVDFLLGSPADNSLKGGRCSLFDFRMTLHVGEADRITRATLAHLYADDWAQLRIDNVLLYSGPGAWSSMGLPPAKCERNGAFHANPGTDLKRHLTPGSHEIWLRVAVADGGEAMAQIHIEVDDSCRSVEQLVDRCSALASDRKCRLDSELVDGIQTFRNGVNTGLRPLPQSRQFGTSSCPVELKREFFVKDRTYRCEVDSTALPQPDLRRGAYIIDRSTETMLADRVAVPGGRHAESTRPFRMPDRGAVPACEPICKTRAPKINDAAAPQGVVASRQNNPASYDTFYHSCSAGNVCPRGPGEEVVSACGCLDDFPEAVVMMQTVRLAGADLVCTAAPR
ncbi:hypothetical protein [Sphingomonas koreensis]